MRRDDIPTARLRRHEAATQESGVKKQQSADAPRLLAAGDLAHASGAFTVMLRAAAESGSEGVVEKQNLAMEARSAETLERMGVPIAAAMVRGAVADEQAALARRAAFQGPGGRQTAWNSDGNAPVSHEMAAGYRRAAAQMPVRVQVERLDADLGAHLRLIEADDPRARGAALAAAHVTLVLASSAVVVEADRHLRRTALDAALPALARAGLGHLAKLVEAAHAHDGDPALQARGVGATAMTGDGSMTQRIAAGSSPADMARYEAAVAAAADPDAVMDEATACFRDLARLTATGDRLAVLGATNRVAEGCLRLCAVPAASSAAAENKTRFLAIVASWAWPRRPALAAVIDAAREAERQMWGGDVTGAA